MDGDYQTFLNSIKKEGFNYKTIFESPNFGVAVYYPNEKGDNFIFLDLNKRGAKISKVKRSNVIEKKVTEAFPGIDKFGLLDVMRTVRKTGDPVYHPVSLYKDKIVKWYENYVYRLPTGQIVAIYNEVKTDDAKKKEEGESENGIPIVSFLIVLFLTCLAFMLILFTILTVTGSHDFFYKITPMFKK